MSYIDELSERVILELTEVLLYCSTCEYQVLELLKVANCIFTPDEVYAVMKSYNEFKQQISTLEKALEQMTQPISMLEIVTLKSMANDLKVVFDEQIKMLELADNRIDEDQIDFEMANLLNELLDVYEYDVVHVNDLSAAMKSRYFIAQLVEKKLAFEGFEDFDYGDLAVLKLAVFAKKKEAYLHALRHGISRDDVWDKLEI